MPELPEVQTILEALTPLILNIPIRDVLIHWPGVVDRPPTDVFRAELRGRAVISTRRRGKYMLFGLDDGNTLVMHLRMTGKMRVVLSTAALHKHDRLSLRLANDHDWRFEDQRKFGRAYLVADAAEMLAKLGPEPLGDDFTAAYLHAHIAQRRAPIKSLLLDQRLVAGIGNIYADEALYRARIHPLRSGTTFTEGDAKALVVAIKQVLQQALAEMGTTLRDYRRPDGSTGTFQNRLQVFRRTGQPCYSCGAPIQRIVVGGRSTHFCPREQPA